MLSRKVFAAAATAAVLTNPLIEVHEPDPQGDIVTHQLCLAVVVSGHERNLIDSITASAITSTAPSAVFLSTSTTDTPLWDQVDEARSLADSIIELGIEQVVIVGGSDAVSERVEQWLRDEAILTTYRAGGRNRVETANATATLAHEFIRGRHYGFNRYCRYTEVEV